MKKLMIVILLTLLAFITLPYNETYASNVALPDYYLEAQTPRYLYRTDNLNRTNKIILEAQILDASPDETDLYTVKIFNREGEFLRYLQPPRAVTITSTLSTIEFSLSSLSLDDEELVFYTVEVDYATVMRGAIMNYPSNQPSGLYVEFDYYMYNDVPLTRYDKDHHNDDLLIIHYRINTTGTDATERVNKMRIFDYVSATPLYEYTRGMIYDIQGHTENYDVGSDVLEGDVSFLLFSKDFNEFLVNPLEPYGTSGLSYPNPNGFDELEDTHLNVILYKQITNDVLYSSDSTRFYSPTPFIFTLSTRVSLDGSVTLNALKSPDYLTDYITTTDIKDNSQPLSVPSELYDSNIIYSYDTADTLNEGDTIGVTWTLTTIYGDTVQLFDTYTIDGSGDTLANFLSFLDYHGLSNGTGKIFVSFVFLLAVNLFITIFIPSTIVYAISNMAIIATLSFMGFVPEYMMLVSSLIITMMFVRALMKGGERYE